MAHVADIFKAASEPIRVRLLNLLRQQPLCVTDLQDVLGLPQSTISRHLAMLRHVELVTAERNGPRAFYRLAEASSPQLEAFHDLIKQACDCEEVLQKDLARFERRTKGKKK